MPCAMRPLDTLDTRLKFARTARGLSQDDLALLADMKQPDISKIERGKILQTTGISRLAAALAVPALWLERGLGAEPDWSAPVQTNTPGVAGSLIPLSQDLRHQLTTVEAPLIDLGSIMAGNVPTPFFRTRLEDDSAAPDYPRGHEVLWEPLRAPRPGRLVLVKDKHGQLHVRQYRQGREPGRWTAAAINPAYASLDSADDGLAIIAVLKGLLEPDD
jgi:transcriptional regulator with XRE-family HTH domain